MMIKRKTKKTIIRKFPIKESIIEKELKIPPDYQHKALKSNNFILANWHRNKMFVIEKLAKLDKKKSVLDLGAGAGNFEILFSGKVKRIVAVDYNYDALLSLEKHLASKKIRNIELIRADITKLSGIKDLPQFDLIIIADVIEHLNQAEAEKFVKYLPKLLKNEGRVIVVTPNHRSSWLLLEQILDLIKLVPNVGKQHLTRFHKKSLNSLFKQNGFTVEKIQTFNLFSFLLPFKRLSVALSNLETSIPIPLGSLLVGVFTFLNVDE